MPCLLLSGFPLLPVLSVLLMLSNLDLVSIKGVFSFYFSLSYWTSLSLASNSKEADASIGSVNNCTTVRLDSAMASSIFLFMSLSLDSTS